MIFSFFPLISIQVFGKKESLNASNPIAVGVAQLAEHRVVASVVVGSIPITHPIFCARSSVG
jgi:hypothetical protein